MIIAAAVGVYVLAFSATFSRGRELLRAHP
jgi:hypothetical protein